MDSPSPAPLTSWDIFCAVVDNYGDVGVCWRLARQLAAEYGFRVRLWVDDPASLHRMCPEVDPALEIQSARGVEVRPWDASFPEVEPADVVVETFGCPLPAPYLEAMARRAVPPRWINLDYLSAETWVEGCHGLPSPHPRLPLSKLYFFPGFTAATGGLLLERGLLERRSEFRTSQEARNRLWAGLGVLPPAHGEARVSLFGYPNPALPGLLEAWSRSSLPITCLVPEGPLALEVGKFLGHAKARPGDAWEKGGLVARVLSFMEQERYDEFLWACDCNFVRGEDSFVRAQWAGAPFVWHIYPQQEDAHLVKLEAFLGRYCEGLAPAAAAAVRELWEAWNGAGNAGEKWGNFWQQRNAVESHTRAWADRLARNGDLVSRLLQRLGLVPAPKEPGAAQGTSRI